MSTYLDVLRYRELLGNLFRRDLQAKYRGSALGVLWTVANPIMLMGVYLLVFGVVWKSNFATGGHYPLFLLTGLALWTFFAAAVQSSTRSMLDNANLIRKTRFPRQLVPLSVVFAHLVSFAVMLSVLLVVNFIVLPRVRATEWLAIPLAVLLLSLATRRRVSTFLHEWSGLHGLRRLASSRAILTPAPRLLISPRIVSRLRPSRRTSGSVQICASTGIM